MARCSYYLNPCGPANHKLRDSAQLSRRRQLHQQLALEKHRHSLQREVMELAVGRPLEEQKLCGEPEGHTEH